MKIDQEGFTNWLRSLPANKTFRRADSCHCPLAEYLMHLFPDRCVGVGVFAMYVSSKIERTNIWHERWSSKFVNRVDKAGEGSTISVEECLKILEAI